jgi:hypothetical protein
MAALFGGDAARCAQLMEGVQQVTDGLAPAVRVEVGAIQAMAYVFRGDFGEQCLKPVDDLGRAYLPGDSR